MTRRSTRLMRLENSLYNYNHAKESWDVKEITQMNNTSSTDLFELGSYFTCKHMSQKVNPISLRVSNTKHGIPHGTLIINYWTQTPESYILI